MNGRLRINIEELCKLPAIKEALARLRTHLPSHLTYHSYDHTLDVISEAANLAYTDHLSERQTELLVVAAAWHDVGFIQAPQNNEPIAAAAATEFLASLNEYTGDEIALIARMILDTAMVPHNGSFRQRSSTPLSSYLLDADVANFGRNDFFKKSELQRLEINENEDVFRAKTLALLGNHCWLTSAAKKLWQETKDKNIQALQRKIAEATDSQ